MLVEGAASRTCVSAAAACLVAFCASSAAGVSLGEINLRLAAVDSQLTSALSDPARTQSLVQQLDRTESDLARIVASSRGKSDDLEQAYLMMQGALARVFVEYEGKAQACRDAAGPSLGCDYPRDEGIALQAEYPLAWSQFVEAVSVYPGDNNRAKWLLQDAIVHFSHAIQLLYDPNLIRENVLGRAYCERELGRYDHRQYRDAIRDFDLVLQDGSGTPQYRLALQGRAEVLEMMGRGDGHILPLELSAR